VVAKSATEYFYAAAVLRRCSKQMSDADSATTAARAQADTASAGSRSGAIAGAWTDESDPTA
jgi:hypothetical protein